MQEKNQWKENCGNLNLNHGSLEFTQTSTTNATLQQNPLKKPSQASRPYFPIRTRPGLAL